MEGVSAGLEIVEKPELWRRRREIKEFSLKTGIQSEKCT
jgi:hypothetical protein